MGWGRGTDDDRIDITRFKDLRYISGVLNTVLAGELGCALFNRICDDGNLGTWSIGDAARMDNSNSTGTDDANSQVLRTHDGLLI